MEKDLIHIETARCSDVNCSQKEECARFVQLVYDDHTKRDSRNKRKVWVADFIEEPKEKICNYKIEIKK